MRAVVVALGDLGRSARMQYHAHALSVSGVDVDFIGYAGAPLPKFLTADSRVTPRHIPELKKTKSKRFRAMAPLF